MVATLAAALLSLAAPPAAPVLQASRPVASRGEVKGGPPLTQAFDLTHRGPAGASVTITAVDAGCGCVRRVLSSERLQPGETATLTVEINTLTQPDGPNHWPLFVRYRVDRPADGGQPAHQPETGTVELAVTAHLAREVAVDPPQVALSATGEATQTLTVRDRRSKPLTVLQVGASSPHLTVAIGAPAVGDKGDRVQPLTLKLAADAPPGHRDEAVTLLTDDPAYPELRVPVRVLKRAPAAVTAYPEAVDLRFAPGEDHATALVQLRGPDGATVAVEKAACEHPAVTLKWSTGAAPVAAVRVTLSAKSAGESGRADVRVRLAEPAGGEVVVPVRW